MTSAEQFRALARSSPWLWHSARFVHRFGDEPPVRAWVRRPQALRVESLAGDLLWRDSGLDAPPGFSLFYIGIPDQDDPPTPAQPRWWTDPEAPQPRRGPDGLVHEPIGAAEQLQAFVDDPMWQNYRWVAMLNPRELADGLDAGPPIQVADLSQESRDGRATLWATVVPTSSYAPRCSCCPLLPSREAALLEGYPDPDGQFAHAHRVALDLATGICVAAHQIGGPEDGRGHELSLEAIDPELPDDLFSPGLPHPLRGVPAFPPEVGPDT